MIKTGITVAERYEILEKIGTGGMSDVYRANDHRLNRYVAFKVLKQEFSENKEFVSKFRTEAQAAAGLMHPNIVNVYDVGEEDGSYYIVMELVEGITLKRYIEKKSRLSVKESVSIAIQVAMGIEAAHNNHIIHRDIKPQNIIISKDGKVKVTDFGIAKAATSNTITSNVMGSVHYTSPEQVRGGFSDEKSDVYSLGITLFEMLTGRVPYNGETTVAVAIKHIQEAMPSPRSFVPEIPVSVEQIVMKCTQKSPDRRYQSAQELIVDLKKSLVTPDEDFVKIQAAEHIGETKDISESEIRQIKQQSRRRDDFDAQLNQGSTPVPEPEEEPYAEEDVYDEDLHVFDGGYVEEYEGDYVEDYDGEYIEYIDEPVDQYDTKELKKEKSSSGTTNRSKSPSSKKSSDKSLKEKPSREKSSKEKSSREKSSSKEKSSKDKPAKETVKRIEKTAAESKNTKSPSPGTKNKNTSSSKQTKANTKSNRRRSRKKEDLEDNYDPRMEALMTVMIIVGAVIVGVAVIYVFGTAIGLFGGGKASIFAHTTAGTALVDSGMVTMPDVQKMSRVDAETVLSDLDVRVRVEYVESNTVELGCVVATTPAAQTVMEKGAEVTLYVSTGSDGVSVPVVVGLSRAEATAKLEGEGFVVKVEQQNSDEFDRNDVISQDPRGDTKIGRGETVTIVVSLGAETAEVEVPDLLELSRSQALTVLEECGLEGEVIGEEYSDTVAAGAVMYQSYSQGTTVRTGTVVELRLSKGLEPAYYTCTMLVNSPADYTGGDAAVVLYGTDGTQLYATVTRSFPVTVNVSGIYNMPRGQLYVTYYVNEEQSTTDDWGNVTTQSVQVTKTDGPTVVNFAKQ